MASKTHYALRDRAARSQSLKFWVLLKTLINGGKLPNTKIQTQKKYVAAGQSGTKICALPDDKCGKIQTCQLSWASANCGWGQWRKVFAASGGKYLQCWGIESICNQWPSNSLVEILRRSSLWQMPPPSDPTIDRIHDYSHSMRLPPSSYIKRTELLTDLRDSVSRGCFGRHISVSYFELCWLYS